MPDSGVSYRFGPLERRSLLGPLRPSQAVSLGVAALVSVLVLDQSPSAGGALLALIVLGLAGVVATVPLGAATLAEWVPVVAAFIGRVTDGSTRHRSALPTEGIDAGPGDAAPVAPRRRRRLSDRPRTLRGTKFLDIPYGSRSIGAISERHGRHLTAVLACRVGAFELLERPAQERRLARWGALLTATASAPIRRLQWIERTAPAHGDGLAQWLHEARDPQLPARGAPLVESYLELISTSAPAMQAHEILLVLQLDAGRVRGGARAAGQALVEQAQRVARALEEADISVLGALSAGQLSRATRTAFDPYARAELAALEVVDRHRDGLAAMHAFPLAADEAWDHYHADGAWHATYWIGAWPRVDVGPAFMNALLGPSTTVRTVAVTFEPVSPQRSVREAEAAVTRDRADAELRHRFGQSATARQRLAQESAALREAELAAGHGEVRFAGFVTVSGRDEHELREACSDTLQLAARARIELYRMYGQQAEAFTFTLPLARGLR